MLDLTQLQAQMANFNAYQAELEARRTKQLRRAQNALMACANEWAALQSAVQKAQPRQLVAEMREAPDRTYAPAERPTPMTVVATDGSQIYPDRHIEPTCYLINIGRIAFQYGTTEAPVMTTEPRFRYRQSGLDHDGETADAPGARIEDHFDDELGTMTAEVVSAIRDEWELKDLLATARQARVEGRPLLALADGTLIRWMIRGMRNRDLEQQLIRRYTTMLKEFMADRLPLASYISMPGNTEVIHLLQFYLDYVADDYMADDIAPDVPLDGLVDRHLFETTLAPGERSAVFSSTSHIQREYPEGNEICYFYVHLPRGADTEIGRVEVPKWVADEPELLRLVHGTILSECDKGSGYPMILSEAHEQAVIRGPERELFYRMLERSLREADQPMHTSRKHAAKRIPRV